MEGLLLYVTALQAISGNVHPLGGIIQGVFIHNDPLENPEKIHGGVGLSHLDNTTLIVSETGPE
jgi:hypothetical protein